MSDASDADVKKKSNLSDLFGDDSGDDESEEEVVTGSKTTSRLAKKTTLTADASGLFGSDSESEDSDSEEEREKAKKKKARLSKKKKTSAPAPSAAKKQTSRISTTANTRASANNKRKSKAKKTDDDDDSEDEDTYQQESSKRRKGDDAFIDEDDDLVDVLGEYKEDREFEDGPDEYDDDPDEEDGKKASRGRKSASEPQNIFDETMKSLKTSRRRNKIDLSSQDLEQLVQEFLYRLDKAYQDDLASIEEGKPGLEKLKFVDRAVEILGKVQLQATLLDFDLLGVLKKWMQPTNDGKLPNLGIRSKLLKAIRRLPVYKDHLKRSGFGKVVMVIWKHPEETSDNKELCRELIDRWSRGIFEKSLDYKKLGEHEAEKAEQTGYRRNARRRSTNSSDAANQVYSQGTDRVRIPQAMKIDFVARPAPRFDPETRPSTKVKPESIQGRLSKKMQGISRSGKQNIRGVAMSIEGRGK